MRRRFICCALLLAPVALAGASAQPPEGAPIRISGTVLAGLGVVPDAEVRLLDGESDTPRQAVGSVRTATDGTFALDVPWRPDAYSMEGWRLAIDGDGRTPHVFDLGQSIAQLEPGSGKPLGALVLGAGCELRGRVVTGENEVKPLGEAAVVLWHDSYDRPWRATTNAAGEFEIERLPPGDYVLGASHSDALDTRRPAELECGPGDAPVTIELGPGTELPIEVRLEDGTVVTDAHVHSVPLPPDGVGREGWLAGACGDVDAAGRYSAYVDLETPWMLMVLRPGSLPGGARWRSANPPIESPFQVTLRSVRRIRGEVTDREDNGLRDAVVTISRLEASAEVFEREVRASADGLFDSGPLEAGRYRLWSTADSFQSATAEVEVPMEAKRPVQLSFVLLPEASVTGRFEVVDREGEPIAGAEVSVGSITAWHGYFECHTGEDGRCEVGGFPEGERARVSAKHADFDWASRLVPAIDPGRAVRIVLDRSAWLRVTVGGTVVDPDGSPVAGATVELTEPFAHASKIRRTASQPDGSFVFLDVPEGGYVVEALSPGWPQAIVRVEVIQGMDQVLVELVPGARLEGRIVDWAPDDVRVWGEIAVRRLEKPGDPCFITVGGAQGLPWPPGGRIEGSSYNISHVAPGEWLIKTQSYPPWEAVVRVAAEDRSLDVDLIRRLPTDCQAAPRTKSTKPAPAEKHEKKGSHSLSYAVRYRGGVEAADCLSLELIDGAGDVVAEADCVDATGFWEGLPGGDFRLTLDYLDPNGWAVSIPSAHRQFEIAPVGSLTLRVPRLEAQFVEGEKWPTGLEVELLPVGTLDGRRPIRSSNRRYFNFLREGWWEVRARTADGGEWNEMVEIREHQDRTLVLR